MNYQERIELSQRKVYEKSVATKILDLMDKLRMSNNENNRKRGIWELLQNAKDVKNPILGGVDIIVDFSENDKIVRFQHNGRSFSTENITFLIEQVSTKERSEETDSANRTTGKFGTGFLTTHLLSEIVEISGVVKDEELPYRKFSIILDRSSSEIEGIIESVKQSIDQLKQLDSLSDYTDYRDKDFNTSFTYHLDAEGIKTAKVGISDLKKNLSPTLIFLSEIHGVKLKGENTSYQLTSRVPLEANPLSNKAQKYYCTVSKNIDDRSYLEQFIHVQYSSCEIILPVEISGDNFKLVAIGDDLPRIFCDFPLVGSEHLKIPFVVNSPFFYPTEPRDGIFLTDKNRQQINTNKTLVKESIQLYLEFIDYAANNEFQNLHLLANIDIPEELDWLSADWYQTNVLIPLQKKIYSALLVVTQNGEKRALKSSRNEIIHIPYHKDANIREELWHLLANIDVFTLPSLDEIHNWYGVFKNKIWDKEHRLTIGKVAEYVSRHTKDLDELQELFQLENPCDWLNKYFDILQKTEEDSLYFLQHNQYKIIPNQYGIFCLPDDLYYDQNIEASLKNIYRDLYFDYYNVLAHQEIVISSRLEALSQDDVIENINKSLNSSQVSSDARRLACHNLVGLFPSTITTKSSEENYEDWDTLYSISTKLFSDNIPSKIFLTNWSSKIRKVSDKLQAEYNAEKISSLRTLLELSQHTSEEQNDVVLLLIKFVRLIIKNNWTSFFEQYLILPNQNGTLSKKESLCKEGEVIDEGLKDIAFEVRRDFRDELLDTRLEIDLPQNALRFNKNIAQEIEEAITPRFSENPRTETTQNIFNKIILWMDENERLAESIFGDLYKNRHRLYDDAEVAENLRAVKKLKQEVEILTEENTSLKTENEILKAELDQAKLRLSEFQGVPHSSQSVVEVEPQDIDDNFLITYGVTTEDRLNELLRNPTFAYFYRPPQQSLIERLRYVMEIIARAKKNIKHYLESRPEYDCSGWTEIGETIVVGICKNKIPIKIVIRPSDNKKIIFYYSEEKNILCQSGAELWVEDGSSTPEQITLGRVLKLENINQINL